MSITLLELVLVRNVSYTPRSGFSEEFFLHSWSWLKDEFLLHSSRWFSEEILLHSRYWFHWGVSLTLLMLVLVRSFSYTPDTSSNEEFLLHPSSWF